MITSEVATVYRGGGRRWFTRSAAINAEAKAKYKAATDLEDRCYCDTIKWDGQEFNDACKYHDHSSPVYGRYIRYAAHCIAKASPLGNTGVQP